MKVYHQLGHFHKWNLESIADDHSGDGVILAPRHMPQEKVTNLDLSVRSQSIFDPQFYVPSNALGELVTYEFFPCVFSNGFDTTQFSRKDAYTVAEACINFQLKNGFCHVVIPTRYYVGTPSTFISKQSEFTVDPFRHVLASKGTEQPILLQLVLNGSMLADKEFANEVLNWVTGMPEISGLYLIVEVEPRQKQLKDPDFLLRMLRFVDILRSNELDVVLGYLNGEALVLSLADPSIVTIGSYEKTRMFRVKNFQEQELQKGGPHARLYISQLLQWIEHPYIGAIKVGLPNQSVLFDKNKYQAEMFNPTFKWHFTKPQLYKHYFLEFSKQLRQVGNQNGKERFNLVSQMINQARKWFQDIDEAGIVLETNSDGSHLPAWLTAANLFAREKGWK